MRKKRLVKAYKKPRVKTKKVYSNRYHYFGVIGLIIVLTLTLLNLNKIFNKQTIRVTTVLAVSRDIDHEKDFWIEVLDTNPNYIPALLELIKIEIELGDIATAQDLLERAKFVNPNDQRVKMAEGLMLIAERR